MSVDLDGILRIHEPLIFCLSVIGKLNLIREEWVFLRDIDGVAAILLKICVAEIVLKIFLTYNMNIEGADIINDLPPRLLLFRITVSCLLYRSLLIQHDMWLLRSGLLIRDLYLRPGQFLLLRVAVSSLLYRSLLIQHDMRLLRSGLLIQNLRRNYICRKCQYSGQHQRNTLFKNTFFHGVPPFLNLSVILSKLDQLLDRIQMTFPNFSIFIIKIECFV